MSKKVKLGNAVNRNIPDPKKKIEKRLQFTFAQFHLKSLNIGDFNNFYKNADDFNKKISVFLDKALPLLSKEDITIFEDTNKKREMHIHKITDKYNMIKKILQEYRFVENQIDNILEGEEVYQMEVPSLNGSMRIVFQKIDNMISFLFMDANHHLYFNQKEINIANSQTYSFCPTVYEESCEMSQSFGQCIMKEYIDENKFLATFKNDFYP